MTTLTGYSFDTADGAEKMVDLVQDLNRQKLITLEDAAIVTWPQGKKKPKTKHLGDMAGAGALGGAFWGMLFGLIFSITCAQMLVVYVLADSSKPPAGLGLYTLLRYAARQTGDDVQMAEVVENGRFFPAP